MPADAAQSSCWWLRLARRSFYGEAQASQQLVLKSGGCKVACIAVHRLVSVVVGELRPVQLQARRHELRIRQCQDGQLLVVVRHSLTLGEQCPKSITGKVPSWAVRCHAGGGMVADRSNFRASLYFHSRLTPVEPFLAFYRVLAGVDGQVVVVVPGTRRSGPVAKRPAPVVKVVGPNEKLNQLDISASLAPGRVGGRGGLDKLHVLGRCELQHGLRNVSGAHATNPW